MSRLVAIDLAYPDLLEEELPNFPEAEFEDGQWCLSKKDDGWAMVAAKEG
jgi:hypothetical protein